MNGLSSQPGVTVIGNLSIDHVDDGPATPGGCPSFAAAAFERLGGPGRVLTKRALRDASLFAPMLAQMPIPVTVLDAETTSSFSLRYDGDARELSVDAVGDPWTPDILKTAAITTTWVHAASLLRDEFPLPALAALTAAGHRIAFDGQGLVRVPRTGPLTVDRAFDRALLQHISVLKLDDRELAITAGGSLDEAAASQLGVAEILVTFGSGGADVYVDGACTHVPSARRIHGVQATGAGDMFTIAYVSARSRGIDPVAAAGAGAELVASVLDRRRHGELV